jgi:hypothetical protein
MIIAILILAGICLIGMLCPKEPDTRNQLQKDVDNQNHQNFSWPEGKEF